MEKSEIDKSLENQNLSESERRVKEIAKEIGLKLKKSLDALCGR